MRLVVLFTMIFVQDALGSVRPRSRSLGADGGQKLRVRGSSVAHVREPETTTTSTTRIPLLEEHVVIPTLEEFLADVDNSKYGHLWFNFRPSCVDCQ